MPLRSLRPHQITAADFLAERPSALLADKMRVGKTPSAIGGADRVGAKNILWLTRGAATVEHAKAWIGFQTQPRGVRVLVSRASDPGEGVNITSYDLASGSLREKLQRPWDLVVFDESHRLKTRDARRTKAAYGEKWDRAGGLAECAPVVWCLSGTPAPSHPAELWPMLRAIMPGVIPGGKVKGSRPGHPLSYWTFVSRYCRTEENYLGHVRITGGKNLAELKAAMEPYVLRRSLEDIAPDLPRLSVDILPLTGGLRLPASVADDVREINAALDRSGVAALSSLAASKGELRRLTGLAKVKAVADWAFERLEDGGSKLVLFAHHVEVVESYRDALRAFGAVSLYGGSSARERREAVERFARDPECRVFVGNLDTAGEAIDLSAADELVFAESSWTPGVNEQAAMRVVNLFKTRPCQAWFATVPGSYDERIQAACADKLATTRELFA